MGKSLPPGFGFSMAPTLREQTNRRKLDIS
jgi:hypothetical protein